MSKEMIANSPNINSTKTSTAVVTKRPTALFVIRHAERIDKVDLDWLSKVQHNRTYDPHLAPKGLLQAKETANEVVRRLLETSDTTTAAGDEQMSRLPLQVTIISSPFIRCLETSHIVAEAISSSLPSRPPNSCTGDGNVRIFVEPGICEVLKANPPHFLPTNDLCHGGYSFSHWIDEDYEPVIHREDYVRQNRGKTRVYEGDWSCIDRSFKTVRTLMKEKGGVFRQNNDNYRHVVILVGHGASCNGIIGALNEDGEGDYVGLSTITEYHETIEEGVDRNSGQGTVKFNMVGIVGDAHHLHGELGSDLRAY